MTKQNNFDEEVDMLIESMYKNAEYDSLDLFIHRYNADIRHLFAKTMREIITNKKIEEIITNLLNNMPNDEKYMINSTMKILVPKHIIDEIESRIKEWENE